MKRMDALAKMAAEPSTIKTYGTGLRRFVTFVQETCASLSVVTWRYATASCKMETGIDIYFII